MSVDDNKLDIGYVPDDPDFGQDERVQKKPVEKKAVEKKPADDSVYKDKKLRLETIDKLTKLSKNEELKDHLRNRAEAVIDRLLIYN